MSHTNPDDAAVASALGMNDPAAEAETQTQDQSAEDSNDEQEVDWQAEAERWKTEARKHERRAKENAAAHRELQKLKSGANTAPNDTTVAEAREQGRKDARDEFGQRLAAADIRAALTGVVAEPNDIIDDLALSRYVTDEGEVDEDAVKALREKYTNLLGKKPAPRVNHGRQTVGPTQKTTADQFADALGGILG